MVTRYQLATENETAAFRRLVTRLKNGNGSAGLGPETFRRFAAAASNATGRRMRIADVDYGVGRLTLSFRWTNFANTTGDRYRVDDVFSTPGGGTWLPSLGPNQKLVVTSPPGYGLVRERGFAKNGSAQYVRGPKQFGPGEPRLAYEPTGTERAPPIGFDAAVAGAVVLAALIAGVVFYWRSDGRLGGVAALGGGLGRDEDRGGTGADAAPPARSPTDARSVGDVDPTPAGGDAESATAATDGAGGEDATAETDDPADESDEVDPSLLSDEERVERIVERNSGRMRQGDIVRETGWSDAKVSQLLSRMDDENRVEKLRLGRENLISLPDDGRNGSD